MQCVGTNVKQWNMIRLLSIYRNVPSNLVIQLAVEFAKVSSYVFFYYSGSLGIWTVENKPLGTSAFQEFVWVS